MLLFLWNAISVILFINYKINRNIQNEFLILFGDSEHSKTTLMNQNSCKNSQDGEINFLRAKLGPTDRWK